MECLKKKAEDKISGPWHGQGHEKITQETATISGGSLPNLSLEPFSLQIPVRKLGV